MRKLILFCVCLLLSIPWQSKIIYVDDDGPALFLRPGYFIVAAVILVLRSYHTTVPVHKYQIG